VKSPTGDTDLVDCSGRLGYIEDGFIKKTSTENILKYSSLFNCYNRHGRRTPLSHIYSIGNKKEDLFRFNCESAKRIKVTPRYTWNDYLKSYLAKRREERQLR
jgi:hypothetical protein